MEILFQLKNEKKFEQAKQVFLKDSIAITSNQKLFDEGEFSYDKKASASTINELSIN